MFDILMYLFENYFDSGSYPDPEKLVVRLCAAGFEDEDINLAVTWLADLRQLSLAEYPLVINHTGSRFYTAFELERICVEGMHFISFWEQNKIISPVEREMIIDRALALGRKNLALDNIKLITQMVLWNQHDDLDPMIIEDLLTPSNLNQIH